MDDDEDRWHYDPDVPDDCDHTEYEIDTIMGRAECHCGHTWWLSDAEVSAELQRQADYWEWCEEQERPWNRFKEWARNRLRGLKIRLLYGVKIRWPRRRPPASLDLTDEIPF